MNEENNQNIPILGSNEGGGGLAPISGFPSGTYKIKFSDEYYQGVNSTNEQIKGRIMLLQNDNVNDGNYFVETSRIYDDALVDKVVSHVSHSDAKYYRPTLEIGFFEEHSGRVPGNVILDYRQLIGGFPPTNEYHFVLDEEWYNKYYGEDSNKVLRTLATGQSDITRHEAFTKAQGLNWANANTPKYVAADKFNGREYVDLGLPSGTLWAKMNVGATSETDPGLYFAWGETEGYTDISTKAFGWNDYKFGTSNNLTKYNLTDGKTVLDAEDDAATVNMGGDWHMPTKDQCDELFNTEYVTNDWVENYNGSGVNGRLFTSVSNSNTLFIPAAGMQFEGATDGTGEWSNVWSSSLNEGTTDDILYAWNFIINSNEVDVFGNGRCGGQSVRGVIGNIDK